MPGRFGKDVKERILLRLSKRLRCQNFRFDWMNTARDWRDARVLGWGILKFVFWLLRFPGESVLVLNADALDLTSEV